MVYCEICGKEISKERIEAFLEFKGDLPTTCLEHSTEQKNKVFQVFAHKTAPVLQIVSSSNREAVRQAIRADRRAR